jgi:hypothetical protein
VLRGDRDAVDEAVKRGEHAPVSDDDDAAPRVFALKRLECRPYPLVEGAPALAAGNDEVGIGFARARERAGIFAAEIVVGEALAQSEVALAQPRVGDNRPAAALGNAPGRLERASEIARDEHVEWFAGKTLRDRFGLGDPVGCELAVALPLDARLDIPMRLTVAHDDEARKLSPPRRRGPDHWIPACAGMTASSPMNGTSAFGTVTEPSLFW